MMIITVFKKGKGRNEIFVTTSNFVKL